MTDAMTILAKPRANAAAATTLPSVEPRCAVDVRVANMTDLPFMDALQKKHSKQLGYFRRRSLRGILDGARC